MNFIPNDEIGEVIKQLLDMGIKVNEKIKIDFFVAFEKEDDAKKFMNDDNLEGFSLDLDFEEDLNCWTCFCMKELLLNYNDIKKTEEYLSETSKPYNGYADGFSTDVN